MITGIGLYVCLRSQIVTVNMQPIFNASRGLALRFLFLCFFRK